MRSGAVGISFRCLPSKLPSASMYSRVLYRVALLARIAFVKAHSYINARFPCSLAEPLGSRTGYRHRLIEQLPVQVGKHLVLSGRNTPYPVRIGGDKGLRKDYQANVVILCCLGDQLASLVDGSFALHKYWRALHGGDLEGRHGPSLSFVRCRYFRDQPASSDYHSCSKPTALLVSPLVYIRIDRCCRGGLHSWILAPLSPPFSA